MNPEAENIEVELCDDLYEHYYVHSYSERKAYWGIPAIRMAPHFHSLQTTCPAKTEGGGNCPVANVLENRYYNVHPENNSDS